MKISVKNLQQRICDCNTTKEAYNTYAEIFANTIRPLLSSRLSDCLFESSLNSRDICDIAHVDESAFSRSLRIYRLAVCDTARLCYKVFGMSVHEFLFQEKPVIALPSDLRAVVHVLQNNSDKHAIWTQQLMGEVETKEFHSHPTIILERLNELSVERHIPLTRIMNFSSQKFCRFSAMMSAVDKLERENPPADITVKTVLFMALGTDVPIDYFVTRDYTQYADIYFTDYMEDGTQMPMFIEDAAVKALLGLLLKLPPDKRSEYITQIVSDAILG